MISYIQSYLSSIKYIHGLIKFNENKIDDAHSKWEIIWHNGNANQKKEIKGFIQLSDSIIQFNRCKLDSVNYLLTFASKNIDKSEIFKPHFHFKSLINDINSIIEKLENNNLIELKINIKF